MRSLEERTETTLESAKTNDLKRFRSANHRLIYRENPVRRETIIEAYYISARNGSMDVFKEIHECTLFRIMVDYDEEVEALGESIKYNQKKIAEYIIERMQVGGYMEGRSLIEDARETLTQAGIECDIMNSYEL